MLLNYLQKEDLKNQDENASRVVACLEEDCGTPPEDAAILLNETPEQTNITNMVEPIDEPGPQTIQTTIDQMEKKPIVADCNHSQSHPNVKEEYVELNDLAETVNVVYPCGEEIVGYPIRNFYAQNIDEVGGNVNLPKVLDVEEFFDFDTMSQSTDLPESLQMTPAEDMNSVPVDFPTDQQPQDDMLLSGNLTFKHENVEMDGHFYSPPIDPSGFEMVDDLLAYFDATEDTLHYDCMEEVRTMESMIYRTILRSYGSYTLFVCYRLMVAAAQQERQQMRPEYQIRVSRVKPPHLQLILLLTINPRTNTLKLLLL